MDGGGIGEMRKKSGRKRCPVTSKRGGGTEGMPEHPPVSSIEDSSGIEKMIRDHERGYIWLEQEWKKNLGISTAGIAVLFLFLLPAGLSLPYYSALFAGAVLANGIWCFLTYRRKYRDYLEISDCLEELETGSYRRQESLETEKSSQQAASETEKSSQQAALNTGNSKRRAGGNTLKTGIRSQLQEQMERVGHAVEVYKKQLEDEKENTKSMITDISHQLKTPVSALRLSLELLGDEQITEEEKREFLERGKQEVEKLNHLMGTLVNLSRLEADMIRLEPRKASLKATLIRGVNGIYLKAEEKQIEMEMKEFSDMELLHDPRWTAEAISNVLDNAVKYSPAKSAIRIRVEPMVSYVLIEVEDEGIGIEKSEYPNIFKRFYRGKRPEAEAQEGAGVGLYLVRKIFEEQGGNVCALPAHGKGTVIRMMLPKNYGSE
ncbi:sensor histidine kinase [Schaedlerella sp.]|uniref:sensor histidine kinase n=1 Tax=Schaedlerella sp. TaxID=2676057 RepID=UPI003528EDE3